MAALSDRFEQRGNEIGIVVHTYPLNTRFSSFFASKLSLDGQVDIAYSTTSGTAKIYTEKKRLANIFNIVKPPITIIPSLANSEVFSSDKLGY
jgi:hypothetical protein